MTEQEAYLVSELVLIFKAFQRAGEHLYLSFMLIIVVLGKWQVTYLECHTKACLLYSVLMQRIAIANTAIGKNTRWLKLVFFQFFCVEYISKGISYSKIIMIVILCVVKPPNAYLVGFH